MSEKKHPISLNAEEEIFISRITDLARQVQKRGVPKFSGFLDVRQQELAIYGINCAGDINYQWDGGYDNAERRVLKLYEDGYGASISFPITMLIITYSNKASLSHRDFLGTILGLGIKREVLGDIIVDNGKTYLWILETMKNTILQDLTRVGRYSVEVAETNQQLELPQIKTEEVNGTVSSLRLDCIVSHLLNCSRENAVKLIKSGCVAVRGREILEPSKQVEEDSILSIRGYGRFILKEIGDVNKKGRIRIYCQKYC